MIEGGGDPDKPPPREIREFHVFPGAQVILTEAGVGLPEPQPPPMSAFPTVTSSLKI